MKIKIDKTGVLHIERAGKMKAQACLYASNPSTLEKCCGDWCPAFGGPHTNTNLLGKDTVVSVYLCKEAGILSCFPKDFTDERGTGYE